MSKNYPPREWNIFHISLIVILTVLGFVFNKTLGNASNFFNSSSSLYFFSALLQANAAIFAIIGVFAVFKIQTEENIINNIKNFLFAQNRNRTLQFDHLQTNRYQNLESIVKFIRENSGELYWSMWDEKMKNINKIKRSIKFPIVLITIGFLLFVIGLFSANFIHKRGFYMEFMILFYSVAFETYIVIFTIRTILKYLKY